MKSTPRAAGKRVATPPSRRAAKASQEASLTELREATEALEQALEAGLETTHTEPIHEAPTAVRESVTETAALPIVDLPAEVRGAARVAEARSTGGKRRAHRGSTRGRLVRLPSVPIAAGIAALAVSAGGAVTAANPALLSASGNDVRVNQASAMGGDTSESRTSLISQRKAAVSRDSRRDALADAADEQLVEQAEAQAQERNAALAKFAKQAENQAAKIALNLWVLPIEPVSITAEFGDYGLWASYHTGIDFNGSDGDPIKAIASGVVTSVGYDGSYGNKTVITLEDGTEIWYCHQSAFDVSEGQEVRGGDLIGYVGSTGNVTGSHLHVEVRPGGGDPVDPRAAFAVHGLEL